MQLKKLLAISIVLRALLIAWGELQDQLLSVKYTDIDYVVFTDAARYVAQGQSPFLRSTYRYSPLLAYMLVPNVTFWHLWGKVLFAAADIIVARQIWQLGQLQGASQARCLWSTLLWLYNPFTALISTRGSCDSVVTAMLLATLLMLMQGQLVLPALLYGLAVHFRIYPIVYAPAIVLYLAHRQLQATQGSKTAVANSQQCQATAVRKQSRNPSTAHFATKATSWILAVLKQGLLFGGLSGGTFLLLGLAFYWLYGDSFLHEAYLHHLTRKDPRHNFSAYYYPIYLDFMQWPAAGVVVGSPPAADNRLGLSHSSGTGVAGMLQQMLAGLPVVDVNRFAALPQVMLMLVLAATLYDQLHVCWLLQTWAFVAFNKVSTAQYFVWYFSLLPCALQNVPWPLPSKLRWAGIAWVVLQLHWLLWGYLLEFKGFGVHLMLWLAGVLFLAANALCMCALIECVVGSSSGACEKS